MNRDGKHAMSLISRKSAYRTSENPARTVEVC